MSAPSTTSYIPLDSDAPFYFGMVLTNNYMSVAFVMLVLYDHVITLDKEVEWIWTLRWRLPKITFLVNRYVLTWLIVLMVFPQTVFPLPLSFCKFSNKFLTWSPLFTFSAAELLMVIRVCSLYGHRKLIILSLVSLLVLVFACATVVQVLSMLAFYTFLSYEFLPGCWPSGSTSNDHIQWSVQWIPALMLEVILILLTAHKVVSTYRNHMNRTITVLARDSTIYFVIIFGGLALTLVDEFVGFTSYPTLLLTQCITSVAVGRMMMNIRGLILDDPEHTVHLQTLEFLSRPKPGSETGEEA